MPLPYGSPISIDSAKKIAAAALDEARRNDWTMAVAVVDPAGMMVYFERMDDTQSGSVAVCQEKAASAALFKRPTKEFQDMLAGGGAGMRVLRIKRAIPVEGGLPVVIREQIVGAIGVSGGTSAQDGQCAKVGIDALS
jgi:glc operon protein GlcG